MVQRQGTPGAVGQPGRPPVYQHDGGGGAPTIAEALGQAMAMDGRQAARDAMSGAGSGSGALVVSPSWTANGLRPNPDNAGGVVGMIEVFQLDFARLESETMASEAAPQREYEQFMHDSEVDKTAKSKHIEHRSAKKQNQGRELELSRKPSVRM